MTSIQHTYAFVDYQSVQEQSSRREVSVLQEQLKSKEDLLAEFQKSLLQKDRELEELKMKTMPQKTVQERKVGSCDMGSTATAMDIYQL